jgi:nitrile hydratase
LSNARPSWLYNGDEFRNGIENMDPVQYLMAKYYERWLFTAEYNLLKKGAITNEEYDARTSLFKRNPKTRIPRRNDRKRVMEILRLIRFGASTRREETRQSRFKEGDKVLARNMNPHGHTRLPRYVRGKPGVVVKVHGVFVLPDTNAQGKGENPEHVYNVRFDAKTLWGDAEGIEAVHVDLWESYIERA